MILIISEHRLRHWVTNLRE